MKPLSNLNFLTIGLYIAVVAACVYAYMVLTVTHVVKFRSIFEMHFLRLWREHRTHFRDSKIRAIFLILITMTMVCFLLEKLLG